MKKLVILNLTLFTSLLLIAAIWLWTGQDRADRTGPAGDSGQTAHTDEPKQTTDPDAAPPNVDGDEKTETGEEAPEEQPSGTPPPTPSDEGTSDGSTGPSAAGDGNSGGDGAGGGEKVNLAFVGDLLLASSVAKQMELKGYDYPYAESLLYLSEPDITAGNLEFPVTSRGTPAENKQYVFKGAPEALPALKESGFDVLSLANNHTMDQGVEGLLDTIQHLNKAKLSHMGAGRNDQEAFSPVIKEAGGVKVAYIGLSKVVPTVEWKADKNKPGVAETYNTTRAIAAIKRASEQADVVVVMVHWGRENADQPEPYQRDFARQYIDAGADLVIGSHPHVLQGFETYKGKWIAYSLGNFIFSVTPKGRSGETGVLDASCSKDGQCQLQFHPMQGAGAQPRPMEAAAAKALLTRLSSISFGVTLKNDGTLVTK
ncbi:CapA family protein [Paenibacillus sp. GCM10023252]|uniref:CapA family protein n=1 Tax=Paenibacillus sp. GCM10023252 TaxID=3252649 RepID=UPI0036171053